MAETYHQLFSPNLYPRNWPIIAYQIKEARGWTCEKCHIQQDADPKNNITVHHKDHNTFNNELDNLRVLCQKCHIREEGTHWRYICYQRHLNRLQAAGQLVLTGFNPYPTTE